jgi:SHS2 domain-containing protein
MSARPGFEFVEGSTSDLAFVAQDPTREGVFAAAAEALLAATLEEPDAVRSELRRTVALEEPALDLLLLRWLNELIYLRDAEQLLLRPRHVALREDGGAHLEAELEGERVDPRRHRFATEVKAATAHGLWVGQRDGGWEARVTLDV